MRRLVVVVALGLVAAACGGDSTSDTNADVAGDGSTTTTAATTTTSNSGGDGTVAQEGDFVAVHYIGTLDDGSVFDESRPRGSTLDFTIGAGEMIAGFDQGVRGMAEGETKTIRIEPADAYGEIDPEAIIEADISQVPEGIQVGDQLINPTTGQPVTVLSIEGDVVTIDANRPLAGESLTFEIEMVSINP